MRLFWTSLLSLALLTSCAPVGSRSACPALIFYTEEFQLRMAVELEALPEGAALTEAMADYSVLRQQVLACRS